MKDRNELPEWKRKLLEMAGTTPPEPKKTQPPKSERRPPDNRGEHRSNTPPNHGQPIRDDSPDKYYLPRDTKDAISSTLLGYTNQRVENFALLLNKCALYDSKQQKFLLSRKTKRKSGQGSGDNDYTMTPKFQPDFIQQVHQRHASAIRALHLEGTDVPLTCTVDWRLIVGLGNESVYETSMTLHHIYGIPYIPGQAVKGLLRSWLILEKFQTEEAALKDNGFCKIFGCPAGSIDDKAWQGNVYFFDAFPTALNKDSIQLDIMNPHYAPYYSEKKPPADYHNPIPVTFLTVQNTEFEFFVGVKNDPNKHKITEGKFSGKAILQVVQEELKNALSQHGLGAKTAVGYGYFQPKEQQT